MSNNKYYVGHSTDLKQRISTHKSGKVKATRSNRPLRLIFYAAFLDKKKAIEFEKYLKSSSGSAFRNKRLI